ncbi:ZIP family metal transporter [Marinobacter sp. JSM 1782161]|uniref:ZIP family metal transporter n=1 Tax=Marinobacter sp. JSM 1782161 TaxID=2685906 RepID=UPI0014036507|nr:divalent cation transporter [Marinobacter sp. JSM 1782161]
MTSIWMTVVLTTLAGAAMPAGALFGRAEQLVPGWLDSEFRHSVIAFGGGALLSAVALVLVPEGVGVLAPHWIALAMILGGAFFGYLDALLTRFRGSVSQLLAMLADFLPESLALGALLAVDGAGGVLLALLVAVQNLPEGFNAYRELVATEPPERLHRKRRAQALGGNMVLVLFCCLVPLGPLAGLVGHLWLAQHEAALGFIMLFASGGILYLVFQDIAPQAKLEKHWAPSLGAVIGFLFGVLGQTVVG